MNIRTFFYVLHNITHVKALAMSSAWQLRPVLKTVPTINKKLY